MEVRYNDGGLTVYDDFAHHPTAIASTLEGLRARIGEAPVLAIIEPRSATMRMGVHGHTLADSAVAADSVFWYQGDDLSWKIADSVAEKDAVYSDIEALLEDTVQWSHSGGHIVIMSNGGFAGFHSRLLERLERD